MIQLKPLLIFLIWFVSLGVSLLLLTYGFSVLYLILLIWFLGFLVGFIYPVTIFFSVATITAVLIFNTIPFYYDYMDLLTAYIKDNCSDLFGLESFGFTVCLWLLKTEPILFSPPLVGAVIRLIGKSIFSGLSIFRR